MQRVRAVLQKLTDLAQRNTDRTIIDVDLMLDYTRVVYADLLDMRNSMAVKTELNINEPTLDELTAAMEQEQMEEEEAIVADTIVTPPVRKVPEPSVPDMPVKDIRPLIDLNDKYLFLSELFQNDLRAYEDTMNELNKMETEAQALQWLNTKIWDEENPASMSFRAILNRFYN